MADSRATEAREMGHAAVGLSFFFLTYFLVFLAQRRGEVG